MQEQFKKDMPLTNYKGSAENYLTVFEQIKNRWGEEAARKYDPRRNCRTYSSWKNELGLRVKRGEHALKAVTFIPVEKVGEVTGCYKKAINLFFYKQLEKIIF